MWISFFHVKKDDSEPTRSFKLPTKSFPVTVKFPIGGSKFLKLEKARIIQFPINNDLATTGHKLQGMTKKYLIVASLNYSTANWIYVVLSRVTTLDGLFLLQPLKTNFNPQPSKLLKEEWKFQRTLEIETLLHLQQSGHFPPDIDVFRTTPEITLTENDNRIQIAKKLSTPVRKKLHCFPCICIVCNNHPDNNVLQFTSRFHGRVDGEVLLSFCIQFSFLANCRVFRLLS